MRAAVPAPAHPAHGHPSVGTVDPDDAAVAEQDFAVVDGAVDAEHVVILSDA
jgi:hypothetical protein